MNTVGLRELKNRLSTYVRQVRDGDSVAVTDRGEIVAELVPPRRNRNAAAGLAQLVRRGELRPALPTNRRKRAALFSDMPRALVGCTSAQLLDAERGER
jgi:prevent-host-death family protein